MKKCIDCGKEKSLEEFPKIGKDGFNFFCKICILKQEKINRFKYPKKFLLSGAKNRAKKNGIPFDLIKEDLIIPEVCPVFKKPFVYGKGLNDFSPSIDRIIPEKGYVKDNIIIVSNRANRIKNNATIEELKTLTNFYEKIFKKT